MATTGHTGDDKVDDRMTVRLAIMNELDLISHPEQKGQPSRPHVTLWVPWSRPLCLRGFTSVPWSQNVPMYLGNGIKKPIKLPIKLSFSCQGTPFGTLKFREGVEGTPSQWVSVCLQWLPRHTTGRKRLKENQEGLHLWENQLIYDQVVWPQHAPNHTFLSWGMCMSNLSREGVCLLSEYSTKISFAARGLLMPL